MQRTNCLFFLDLMTFHFLSVFDKLLGFRHGKLCFLNISSKLFLSHILSSFFCFLLLSTICLILLFSFHFLNNLFFFFFYKYLKWLYLFIDARHVSFCFVLFIIWVGIDSSMVFNTIVLKLSLVFCLPMPFSEVEICLPLYKQ